MIALGSFAGVALLGIGGCFFAAMQYQKEHPEMAAASNALLAVELEVMSYKGAAGLGSNEQARSIATQYATAMRAGRQIFFTGKDDSKWSFSANQFVTYCGVLPGRCVFVVHVPQLRNYSPEAERAMADMAWRMAVGVVRDRKLEVTELAVGLHGAVSFGEILVGTPQPPTGDSPTAGVKLRTKDQHVLLPFFATAPEAAGQKR